MIGNRHLPEDVHKRLIAVMWPILEEPGQHRASDQYEKIRAACEREGIPVTLDDIKQEYRDAAGYP
jgi:hypothetical protein